MDTEPEKADDIFKKLLRQAVAKTVTAAIDEDLYWDEDIIVRLMNYEMRARQEELSSQTLQVIQSGKRLLGK
ncbi:hypothetical protein MEX01_23810 [Methylorubrum extorquens]|uniref:hypothetical protein n=1 Tax=Methylorubrum extorquens TaxID=408 RepID=UPI00116724FC|nr:hypothetical protein [Methylorubrum extorquens]GEL41790.1 hypothetical protein MEX01_23810 [Methylorubrum extorquens]